MLAVNTGAVQPQGVCSLAVVILFKENILPGGEISGSHGGEYVVWDVAPCSLVETNRRFRDAYCLYQCGYILYHV
jgi:hypothetical protein